VLAGFPPHIALSGDDAGWLRSAMSGETNFLRWFPVDGCDLCLAAGDHCGSEMSSGLSCLVGEVAAFLVAGVGRSEVEGVGVATSAEGDVGPLPVCVSGDDGEGAIGGEALGLVGGERISVPNIAFIEIPAR